MKLVRLAKVKAERQNNPDPNKSNLLPTISQKVAISFGPSLSLQSTLGRGELSLGFLFESVPKGFNGLDSRTTFVWVAVKKHGAPAFRYPAKGSISILDRCRKTNLPSVKASLQK